MLWCVFYCAHSLSLSPFSPSLSLSLCPAALSLLSCACVQVYAIYVCVCVCVKQTDKQTNKRTHEQYICVCVCVRVCVCCMCVLRARCRCVYVLRRRSYARLRYCTTSSCPFSSACSAAVPHLVLWVTSAFASTSTVTQPKKPSSAAIASGVIVS
jgi:hypothetical protein